MSDNSELDETRGLVAHAARDLAAAGLVVGTAGNISARCGELVAITPTGAALEALEPDQVTVVDLDGDVVRGSLAPTSELDLHLGVYRRYEAGAVVHTHAPVATALSCALDELPCIHYQMLMLGGAVRVAPFAPFGSVDLAEVTLDALEGRFAALMANHGAIAYSHDLPGAVAQMRLLEWSCELYWRAASVGTPRALDEAQQAAVVTAALERNYGSTRRV
jgi:L-fuculose-phosphate aldolase